MSDIEDNLREIYGADVPQTMISKITDKILPEVNEWQNRPLESVYPIIYFDGIVFKSRKDSQIINRDRKIPARTCFKCAFFAKRKIMKMCLFGSGH